MLQQSWKKVYSRATTKSNPLLQPEHRFCHQNGPEDGQFQDWYPDEKMVVVPFVWMVDVVLQGARVLYCINKDEGDESLPFLVFWRHIVNTIFLKDSKEARLSSSHVAIRNIPSDVCYGVTKHQVQSEHNHTQNPFKHLRWSVFAQTVNTSKSLTAYAKKLHLRCLKGLWICICCRTRCAKRTLNTATWNINLHDVCVEIFQWY